MTRTAQKLRDMFDRLLAAHGPQGWWPGETPFEVMVGAVLTQNTNWGNVEKAMANLKAADLLTPPALAALAPARLADFIRPAGYYNIKAARLHHLLATVAAETDGDLEAFLALPLSRLREALLSTKGIGPETCDAICCYAAHQPIFVVDAYTFRVLGRHGLADEDMDYFQLQEVFMDHLPADAELFGEFHALLVRVGKTHCKKSQPRCEGCPLEGL